MKSKERSDRITCQLRAFRPLSRLHESVTDVIGTSKKIKVLIKVSQSNANRAQDLITSKVQLQDE